MVEFRVSRWFELIESELHFAVLSTGYIAGHFKCPAKQSCFSWSYNSSYRLIKSSAAALTASHKSTLTYLRSILNRPTWAVGVCFDLFSELIQ